MLAYVEEELRTPDRKQITESLYKQKTIVVRHACRFQRSIHPLTEVGRERKGKDGGCGRTNEKNSCPN